MVEARRGTVTVLFTDIVGSTELMQRLGDDHYDLLRRRHFELLRNQIAAFRGDEVKSAGDGLMVTFASALDAVDCGVAMQQDIHRHNQEHEGADRLLLRVGMDAGEPIRDEDGDYHGTPVVVARRLSDDAEGGQILASQLVSRLVGSRGGHTFRDLEPRPLQGLAEPLAVCEVAWEAAEEPAERAGAKPAVLPLPPLLAGGDRTTFVGRERELRQLQTSWELVKGGSRRLVLLAGEPGIGKTRLAAQFARLAHADEAAVLYGRCYEEAVVPYQPFVEALRQYVQSVSGTTALAQLRTSGEAMSMLIPELAQHARRLLGSALPSRAPPNLVRDDPESERYWFFEAITSVLADVARRRPLVVILDDLHWADAPTLQLLKHIMRAPEDMPLLIVGTYREGELQRSHPLAATLADLRRERAFERVHLEGLDSADTATMIAAWADGEVPAAVTDAISARTEGNPFFIQEVLAHLWEMHAAEEKDGGWVSRLAASINEYGLPEGIKEVVGRRLSRLSDDCNAVLSVASVIGREFEFAVLEGVSDLSSERVLNALDEALAAGVLSEVSHRSGGYGFTHPLIRETLYDEITTARRIRLHGRVGLVLEELTGGDEEAYLPELAHHFFEAASGRGDVDKAIRYAERAGDRAKALFAYEEATQHYERALQALDLKDEGEREDRVRLLLDLGLSVRMTGDWQTATGAIERAIDIARGLGAPDLLARAVLGLRDGFVELGVRGPDDAYVGLLHEALDGLGEREDALRAGLLGYLAGEYYMSPDEDQRLSLSAEAVELARRAGDPEMLAFTLVVRHYCIRGPKYAEARAAAVDEILDVAQRIGARGLALSGYASRIEDLLELGDVAALDRTLDVHARLAGESRMPRHVLHAKQLAAMRALLAGSFDDAESLADEALALGQRARSRTVLAMFSIQTFLLRKEQGRLAEIEEAHKLLAERFAEVPAYRCALALLYCELARSEDARREFDRLAANRFAAIPRDTNWIMPVVYLAEACAKLTDSDRARDLYDLLLPYDGSNIVVGYGAASFGPAARYLGLLAATVSRWDDAVRHFEEAAALGRRMGAKPWIAHTLADHAGMLSARDATGDRKRARELLDESLEHAEALGMTSLMEQIRTLSTQV